MTADTTFESCDVAVLGGGPAGAACAIALARAGVGRVVLCESEEVRPFRLGETIPPDSRALLDRLGVLDAFLADEHMACHGSCSSWGSGGLGYNDFMLRPYGHGWHIDRPRFEELLLESAAQAGAELWLGAQFAGTERIDGGHRLAFRGAPALEARFVVDATGCSAAFARRQEAQRTGLDTLHCIAARFRKAAPGLSRLTWLEAVPEGWWYASRLPSDRLLVLFASDADVVRDHGFSDPETWLAALRRTRHIRALLEHVSDAHERPRAGAAPSFCLDRVAGHGWAALGDAASSCDPVTARGLWKALSGALVLADAIPAALAGDTAPLDAYAAAVRQDFTTYRAMRRDLYGLETRWPDAPFWARRHASVTA